MSADAKKEIDEIDKAIYKSDNGVKIVGEIDQSGALIVGEGISWQAAAERQKKRNELLARKSELVKAINKPL